MIITRTPFRVSFAGGGSDLKDFYSRNGYGAVVSTAIRKYMYIVIHPYFHDKIRIKYSRTEDVEHVDDIQHPVVRECLKRVQIERGIEIASFADIPAGTGLGSSSAFTVGLLNALYTYRGKIVPKGRLAREACEIEIDTLGEPIGKQDQYAAAYGNINYIRFNKDETVDTSPIFLTDASRQDMESHLNLYYIGGTRKAGDILSDQRKNMCNQEKFNNLEKMVSLADEFREILENKSIQEIGKLLHRGWLYKKELADGISNSSIDGLYERARALGAEGGKILGAGGAGFLLLFAKNHEKLQNELGCRLLPLTIDREGTKVIFYD